MIRNKKGQIGGLQGIIMTLVIVGILLGVGFLVLTKLTTTMQDTTTLVVNETITPTTAGKALAYNSTNVGCYYVSVLKVYNDSGFIDIDTGNYSYNPYTGVFKNLSSNIKYDTAWNVTYSYESGDLDTCKGVEDTSTAMKNVPEFLPIIIIVAIVGILLAIVFNVLPRKNESAYV